MTDKEKLLGFLGAGKMTKEEIDKFCGSCDKKRKQGECLLKNVCKGCKDFYDCVVFCIAEKRTKNG